MKKRWLRGWKLWVLSGDPGDRRSAAARAGSGDAARPESRGGDRRALCRLRRLARRRAGPSRRRLHGAAETATKSSPPCSTPFAQAQVAHQLRKLHLRRRRGRRSVHPGAGRGRAARRHRAHRARRPSARALGGVAEEADRRRRRRSSGSTRCGRGRSRRPTTARIASCSSWTARRRSPAASGFADHWLGNADAKEHWRDTQFNDRRPSVRALEARSTRTGSSRAASRCPRSIPSSRRSAPARDRSWSGAIRPAASATSSCCTCSRSPARARTIDIQSPYFVLDESTPMGARRGAPARRARSDPDRRRHHRRQAGEVRQPRRIRRAARRPASRSSSTSRR